MLYYDEISYVELEIVPQPPPPISNFHFCTNQTPGLSRVKFWRPFCKISFESQKYSVYLDAILLINWKLFEMKSIFNEIGLKVRTGGTAALRYFPSKVGSAMAQK